MTRLFLDTETTGGHPAEKVPGPGDISIPAYGIKDGWPDHLPEENPWPRVVQVAWSTYEGTSKSMEKSALVRPEDFGIPDKATEVHGITTEDAQREGSPLQKVLDQLEEALNSAEVIVAHNADFDVKTLAAEYFRHDWEKTHSGAEVRPPVQQQSYVCTMKSGTDLCAIPREEASGYKWPTLQELHEELFGETFEDAHDALADVKACARCFFEMRDRGVNLHA